MTIGRIPSVEGGIQPTIVTAKGDLIVATGNATLTRQPVGSNDQVLVADSTQADGVAWKSVGQLDNPVINGGMDIWQRGTTFSSPATNTYTADRWQYQRATTTATTISRQTISSDGNQYSIRVARDSGSTNVTSIFLYTNLETSDSIPYQGKTITLSFYARVGANFSASNLSIVLNTGTGTDQNFATSGYTNQTAIINTTAAVTTSWQRFTFTGSVSSVATQIGFYFGWTPVGTAGANDWAEITGVQIDLGSTAAPFRRSGGTIQGELAACQRYFQTVASGNGIALMNGAMYTATAFFGIYPMKVTMRTTPTISQVTGTNYYRLFTATSVTDDFDGITALANGSNDQIRFEVSSGISVTAGQAAWIITNNAASFIGLQAELQR